MPNEQRLEISESAESVDAALRLTHLSRLATGVAHDVNNLLTVIRNHASLAAETISEDDDVRADVEQIRVAARCAARLTGQLLTLARANTMHLELLDLNEAVAEVETLLSRTIGEHIELVVRATSGLPAVRAGRGQLEQVLVNLMLNARDAMPGGGVLTVDTGTVARDAEGAGIPRELAPGRYVMLAVSDTGVGMSPEVVARAAEPWYTTKHDGEGSGLGLTTVCGIVREVDGAVTLVSEAGRGTTVRVFLPVTGRCSP